MKSDLKTLLKDVKENRISIDEAILRIKKEPFEDIDFAKVDAHRKHRQGANEVIYGEGKTSDQIVKIAETLISYNNGGVLITRISKEKADLVGKNFESQKDLEWKYFDNCRIGILGNSHPVDVQGNIVVVTGGTSDIPVAEEAAVTAEFLGNKVVRIYDVGVSGLHRLLAHMDEIMGSSVIIAIAGMEGALASVVGGLADCPVIAVPTSVGYGASFEGLSALLSMLNSCASGVTVVNIDNGFGAGYSASMINHMGDAK